ncbi:restriction endonuclease subunit S [Streptococcus infantis]|uniref:restriction endonuclease subunit S n=1 Tax=Streptococcus infantis TaxID=68892 RepID=UPI0039C049FD
MKYVKLGNIAKFRYGKMPDKDKFLDDGYPVFSGYRITGYYSEYMVENPTLIVVARGVGGTGDVKISPPKSYITNLSIIVDLDESVADMRYLYYQFVCNNLRYLDTGAAQSQITINNLSKHKALLPRLVIQKKISSILTTYDNLIENNNKRIKLLEQMAENLYKEWFVRFRFPGYEDVEFENGIPKGWEVKKIKNCVKRLPFNRLYKRNELESEGKVIVIDQSSAEFLGYHNDEPSHCASIDKPVLLFGDHSCKFVLMIREFSLGENVVPFISENENKLNDYYLFYAVHKIIVTEEYKRHWGRFTGMKILVPDYELQIVFADFIKPIIQEQNNLWNEIQLLIKQRDMLLPRLMSGKLEV